MKTLARPECRAEILRRLNAVRPETPARWGRMTAHQMICHLADACRMATGEKPVTGVSVWLPKRIMKWLALYVPAPWPTDIPTSPEIDQLRHGTKPTEFGADVRALETLLEAIASRQPDARWPAHPVFGKMSQAEWLRWAYLHVHHHLRQFAAF